MLTIAIRLRSCTLHTNFVHVYVLCESLISHASARNIAPLITCRPPPAHTRAHTHALTRAHMHEYTRLRTCTHDKTCATRPCARGRYYAVVDAATWHHANEKKAELLLALLDRLRFRQCIVFCNLRSRAQQLADAVNAQGIPCGCVLL
jgi:hypothetical protein